MITSMANGDYEEEHVYGAALIEVIFCVVFELIMSDELLKQENSGRIYNIFFFGNIYIYEGSRIDLEVSNYITYLVR